MKEKIIQNGVKNLKEFGYPHVNEQNILTDIIYSAFFKNMLEENKGQNSMIDEVLDELIDQINANQIINQ